MERRQNFRESVKDLESQIKTLERKKTSRRFINKVAEIELQINELKANIEELRTSYAKNTRGYQNKIKKQQRREARAAAGGRVSRSSKDNSFIPWIPVKIENGRVVTIVDEITSEGHIGKYTASWVEKLPAVKIVKNKTTAHAYYGMRRNGTRFLPPGIVNNSNTIVTEEFNSGLTKSKIIHHSRLTGIGVSNLNRLMSTNSSDAAFYLDTKLIMDRYTADQAKWVNSLNSHYVMKPFSSEFASLLDMWKRSIDDKDIIIAEMNQQLENSMPYYFNQAGVYSGDRPLILYCIYKQIPYIWERQTSGVTTYYMKSFITSEKFKEALKSTNDKTLKILADNINNSTDFLNMLKIIDTFHDFVGPRSFTTKEQLKDYINSIYKNKYTDFVETVVSGTGIEGRIRTIENNIGNMIINISMSVKNTAGDSALYKALADNKLLNHCWIYDAGTQIPLPILQKLASTTQRATNSFLGPLARLQASNYNVQPTDYFTLGRDLLIINS